MTAMVVQFMKVLLVEDNPGDARLVQEMFQENDPDKSVEVCSVDRLEHGLNHLGNEQTDVVLLDLGLPDSIGLDTFAAVQQHAPSTPVIVLTGLRDDETAARALREGAQDYLIKGQIDADRLLRSVRYAIERKRAEEQLRAVTDVQRLLLSELDHRVRNNLASLLSLVDFGERQYTDVKRFAQAMRQRVQTMATVHTLLSRSQWTSICLQRLLRSLLTDEQIERTTTDGPRVVIPVKQVHAFGMVLHEFITNSAKYGALGSEGGMLTVKWRIEPLSHDRDTEQGADQGRSTLKPSIMHLVWRERGGPRVEPPKATGIGTKIIEGLARSELQGSVEFDYAPDGVTHRLTSTLDPDGSDHARMPGRWSSEK